MSKSLFDKNYHGIFNKPPVIENPFRYDYDKTVKDYHDKTTDEIFRELIDHESKLTAEKERKILKAQICKVIQHLEWDTIIDDLPQVGLSKYSMVGEMIELCADAIMQNKKLMVMGCDVLEKIGLCDKDGNMLLTVDDIKSMGEL